MPRSWDYNFYQLFFSLSNQTAQTAITLTPFLRVKKYISPLHDSMTFDVNFVSPNDTTNASSPVSSPNG